MNVANSSWWFIFYGDNLLLKKQNNHFSVPCGERPSIIPSYATIHAIGVLDHLECYTVALSERVEETDYVLMKDLRSSYDFIALAQYKMAGKAFELLHWDRTTQFCPVCGTHAEQITAIMKRCPQCKHEMFPTVSAAVLVLIRKENSILLVHAHNFVRPFNSLVAGFLETGETLEECVSREVKEETSLDITNISYFGSQPWPYPNNIMIGFVADYVSGTIKLQTEELSSGDFYTRDHLPEIPRKLSLARKMIDWWIEQEDKKRL